MAPEQKTLIGRFSFRSSTPVGLGNIEAEIFNYLYIPSRVPQYGSTTEEPKTLFQLSVGSVCVYRLGLAP